MAGRLVTHGLALTVLLFRTVAYGAESRWIRLQSPNFEMYSSASQRGARDTLREFEQVHGFFLQLFKAQPEKAEPVRLVAFGSVKEYEPYRPNEIAIAYYHQTSDRDYIVMSHSGADTFPVAVHEYVHLLVSHTGLKLPPWLNEGLAELYSTLKPLGGKILIGELIEGRHQALLREKWVPLATILAADHTSPYYNEKSKAGSLYNEGWALTHMLCLSVEYHAKFGDFVKAVSDGADSAEALQKVYGQPLEKVEKNLQAYLRGSSFSGAVVDAKLEKSTDDIPAESLADFDTGLMFADLLQRPGNEEAATAALQALVKQDPKRPEPYRGLAYIVWRDGRRQEAVDFFGKAYERGARDPRMLWDYGRLIDGDHGDDAIRVMSQLLQQDAARMDVRLTLAEMQLRARRPKDVLETLGGVKKITPADMKRYFTAAIYAHLLNGDQKSAEGTANHYLELAKSDADRTEAKFLLQRAASPLAASARSAISVDNDAPPVMRNREIPGGAPDEELRRTETNRPPAPVVVSGRFVELDCRGTQARMIVETGEGKKSFLIADPERVAITAGSSGPVEMTCGVQKKPVTVAVGYLPPGPGQTGVEGIVKTLAF